MTARPCRNPGCDFFGHDALHGYCTSHAPQVAGDVDVDPVNHPKHYSNNPSGVECITVVEHMSFNVGNAIKYLWRHGDKGNPIQDLEKARWYVDREITRIGGGQS